MNTNEKNEQVEQVETNEVELDVKRVKSLRTSVKAGLASRPTSEDRRSFGVHDSIE